MKKILLVALIFLFMALSACATKNEDREIKNIVRVFYHQGTNYTFVYKLDDSKELKRESIYFSREPRIIMDVPAGEPIWIKYTYSSRWDMDLLINGEIHLRNSEDLNPGGWNRGKLGRGQNTVLE